MRFAAFFAVCILQMAQMDVKASKYTVIGPGTLHSASKYNVAVAVYETSEPSEIKVGITGPSYNETKNVKLNSDEVKIVEFDVPVLESGNYNLTAEGVSGISFANSTRLNYEVFSPHVKIQTDKGNYKPGDEVKFRVLFLDENLKPAKQEKDAVIWFEDGKRNRIKEIKNFEAKNGVYTDKFQISEFPVLGGWRLLVKNGDGYNQETYFEVAKYVLSKYTVKVEATENVAVQDGDMQVIVRSNYTYDKPVDAKVTLVLNLPNYHFTAEKDEKKEAPAIIKTADMVNGKAKFDLNVKEYEPYMKGQLYAHYLQITATVEENFTGVKINGTASTTLYPYRYAMGCVNYHTCSTFHVDKENEMTFLITHVDGTLLKDTKSVVKAKFTEKLDKQYFWRGFHSTPETTESTPPKIENRTVVFESHLNESSQVVFKVMLPALEEIEGYNHYYNIELEYAGEKRDVSRTNQYKEPKKPDIKYEEPKEYLRVNAKYAENKWSLKIGEEATFPINSSAPLSYFVYVIIGRGNVLETKRVELSDKPKEYNLTITPTFLMAPYGKLYIFYVDEQHEFKYAETHFSVDVELQNQIEITAPEQVKPGEEVMLQIKTSPNSLVGLLAVDQSVLLLGNNNELSATDFQWRLGSYDSSTPWQGGYSHYPGELSGVVTLTNAYFFYNLTKPEMPAYNRKTLSTFAAREPVANDQMEIHASAAPQGAGAAFGGGGGGAAAVPVRKDFSETWIFEDIENDAGTFTWSKKIPDTITKWILSGFSLSPDKGLGITNDTTKIRTFQPFFVSIRLPYSVKRGEVINIPALVFNYLEKDLDVDVTLDNTDDEFEFTDISNEVINDPKRTKSVRVPANSARGVTFLVRPKIIGNILLKFTALSPVAGDAIHKTMKVIPEGVTEYGNHAYFVNLKDTPEFKETFELKLPSEIVPDSQHVEFAVVGDLLGPLLNNLNNLVRMPTGCGEQTMSTMMPNYLMLRYLKATNKLTPALKWKAKRNLEIGYQHMLNFAHDDGSFSSFGPQKETDSVAKMKIKPHHGSTWLTAYVIRSLQQIREFVNVDEKVLEDGLKFLASKQAENGSFVESGDFFYASAKHPVTLTAKVLLAFVENATLGAPYQTNVDKGFKYILDNLEKTDDLHAKAFAVYTLHQAKQAKADEELGKLKALAKTEDDRMWWTQSGQKLSSKGWCCFWSYSGDVEITSYILLTLLDTESVDSVLPVLKWLVGQRNSYGGFYSTQDTVIGLQALIKFAEKSGYEAAVMDVDLTAKGGKEKRETIKANEDNALLMQIVELPPKTETVEFNAKGKGAALMQISYQYNIVEKDPKPSFVIKTIKKEDTPPAKLELDVCVEYSGENEASNMAVLEVALPSGYIADEESFEFIKSVDRVRHTETKNADTTIVVYFESLPKGEVKCLPIVAYKSFAVALQKPVPVVLYDYYDTSKRATDYYEAASKLCDICEDDAEECQNVCK